MAQTGGFEEWRRLRAALTNEQVDYVQFLAPKTQASSPLTLGNDSQRIGPSITFRYWEVVNERVTLCVCWSVRTSYGLLTRLLQPPQMQSLIVGGESSCSEVF
jgi:hypothetical protein